MVQEDNDGSRFAHGTKNLAIVAQGTARTRELGAEQGYERRGWNEVFRSVEEAKPEVDGRTLFIIGGGELYSLALADCDELYLTEVHQEVEGGDAFFPDHSEWFDPSETLHECDDFTLRKWLRRESV